MLKEKRAATLTQFLVTRLVVQGGEEADGTLVQSRVCGVVLIEYFVESEL
jgi:hypothetical protein